ncbi:MAG TPA: hypothetical protein VMF89_20270, partial [Polyangiales bacterium]|nr:hypothetical protein [Polyangiales bacterium]
DGATIATASDRPAEKIAPSFQHIVLTSQDGGRRTVMGGVLVEMPASALQRLDLEFRSALADALRSPHER